MKNLKITKGEFQSQYKNNYHAIFNQDRVLVAEIDEIQTMHFNMPTPQTCKANAELIKDAFNTANKCGKLPSELLAERDELLKVLIECRDIFIEKEIPLLITFESELDNAINKTLSK